MANYIMPGRLDRIFYRYQDELEAKALEVLRSGRYVLGPEVEVPHASASSAAEMLTPPSSPIRVAVAPG